MHKVTRESVIRDIEIFLKKYKKTHRKEYKQWERFETFVRDLADDIKQARIEEHIEKHSKKGRCNKVLLAGVNEEFDFYDGYDDTKTGCGSYGNGMPCVCNKPKGHKGNCVCGECGEEWV
jgi:hypothetical protein